MSRLLALGWLALLLVAAGYLTVRTFDGLDLRTDLLALLPKEEQDPALSQANDRIMQKLAGRVILLVGSQDRARARRAASEIEDALVSTKLIALDGLGTGSADPAALGAFYFRYRGGLLSEPDRRLLTAGEGAAVAERALAQVYGVGSFADAKLLAADPFLLLPRFLTGLPVPSSRLTLDEGRLSVQEHNVNWVLVAGRLLSDPYELDTQERLVSALDGKIADLRSSDPTLSVKQAGAVFFARSGANIGLTEASLLGSISLIGTVALLLVVFRHPLPLVLNVFTLLIGTGAALSATLAVFGEVHIMTLLFGVGLIGVAVDYGLHYSTSAFDPGTYSSHERLMHVLPAISLGLLTTLIGYVMLALAPFPGLRQIAFFSTIGLVAAFLTVALWFPLVKDARPTRSKDIMMRWAEAPWRLWEIRTLRPVRWTAILLLAALGVAGLMRLNTNDDVRSMQSLSPELVVQQADIQRVAGFATGWQSILITAEDDEAALVTEEGLDEALDGLVKSGAMAAYRAPASFVPSQARQRENAKLVDERLVKPFLAQQRARLGLTAEPTLASAPGAMTLPQALASDATGFLDDLVLAPGQHLIALDAVTDPMAVRSALTSAAGARFIDPTEDFSRLLARYRYRAVWLIAVSTILMLVPLWWRYGAKGALIVIAPALAAVVLAPALIALTGQAISFFHVMALMIVLSIGVDFAIFCAEGSEGRRLSASLAVVLAAMTTLLSFGILAFSQVLAVHSFGLTLLLGVLIAFLLAPVALQVRPVRRCQPRAEMVS
jgi:predicted exporter